MAHINHKKFKDNLGKTVDEWIYHQKNEVEGPI